MFIQLIFSWFRIVVKTFLTLLLKCFIPQYKLHTEKDGNFSLKISLIECRRVSLLNNYSQNAQNSQFEGIVFQRKHGNLVMDNERGQPCEQKVKESTSRLQQHFGKLAIIFSEFQRLGVIVTTFIYFLTNT